MLSRRLAALLRLYQRCISIGRSFTFQRAKSPSTKNRKNSKKWDTFFEGFTNYSQRNGMLLSTQRYLQSYPWFLRICFRVRCACREKVFPLSTFKTGCFSGMRTNQFTKSLQMRCDRALYNRHLPGRPVAFRKHLPLSTFERGPKLSFFGKCFQKIHTSARYLRIPAIMIGAFH